MQLKKKKKKKKKIWEQDKNCPKNWKLKFLLHFPLPPLPSPFVASHAGYNIIGLLKTP